MYFNGTANYLARQLIKLHVRGALLFTVIVCNHEEHEEHEKSVNKGLFPLSSCPS